MVRYDYDDFLARHPRLQSAIDSTRPYLPRPNFIMLHYAYFLAVCAVSTLVFWGSDSKLSISFVDSLFNVVSAMTEAGLNTVNLSEMSTFQQILLFLLIMLGGSVWVSIWTVQARIRAFESRFEDILRREHERAQFTDRRHELNSEERKGLGGTEYQALKVLAVVVPAYFFLWQLLGCVALGAWIHINLPGPARANGISPWWNGIFNAVSAFNNSGMSVLDANMVPYGRSYFVLIVMCTLILAGNTAYPVFLRLWLWFLLKLLRTFTYEDAYRGLKEALEYILRYPRRVSTNLFPAYATWWLVFMLFVLNGTDWVGFEVLNLGNPALSHIPVGAHVMDGLFQAIAVRSGGFSVVPISDLYIGLQVLYVVMMYISVYPVVITMRHYNVYEERSLGIYTDDVEARRLASPGPEGRVLPGAVQPATSVDHHAESRISFLGHQVRGHLTHDLWLLVLAVFAISVIETGHFLGDRASYSVFNILFEVVSAYGTVGISTGTPGATYSLSGSLYTGSKLVLCLVMLRGRHRGLPIALDRVVRLPSDDHVREEEDYRILRSVSVRDI